MRSPTIPFVTMKWARAGQAQHKKFTAEHVNNIRDMLVRTQEHSFRLFCITDDPEGLHDDIVPIPIPPSGRTLIDGHGAQFVKLFMFSANFRNVVGQRFIYLDLDVAVVGDLTQLCSRYESSDLVILEGKYRTIFDKVRQLGGGRVPKRRNVPFLARALVQLPPQDFLIYLRHGNSRRCTFNSSFMIIARDQPDDLWEDFDAAKARHIIMEEKVLGSDQAWLQLRKSGDITIVSTEQGIWSKSQIDRFYSKHGVLPKDLRLVIFAGEKNNPWSEAMQKKSWVQQIYRQAGKIS
ncbi:MAG: hypothetical protein ACXW06_07855 [Halobacteriota archaeon]